MSERGDEFVPGLFAGLLLGICVSGLWWSWMTRADEMVSKAIRRRGYDVEALSNETEVDYWKALATGRVADPQPVKEIP